MQVDKTSPERHRLAGQTYIFSGGEIRGVGSDNYFVDKK